MQKYLIDCGAHEGKAIKSFRSKFSDAGEYIIHAFEPNPFAAKNYGEGVVVHDEAVWINDGEIDFYITKGKKGSPSATIYKQKITGRLDKKHPVKVRCIDFSNWLRDNVKLQDYVIVKMNMEGAEYPVIGKLILEETIELIDVLYVKFHAKKIKLSKFKHLELLEELNKYNVKVIPANL